MLIMVVQAACALYPATLELIRTTRPSVRWLVMKYAGAASAAGLVGAAFFISHFPENVVHFGKPSNVVFSHGLMHVAVLISARLAFAGYSKFFKQVMQ